LKFNQGLSGLGLRLTCCFSLASSFIFGLGAGLNSERPYLFPRYIASIESSKCWMAMAICYLSHQLTGTFDHSKRWLSQWLCALPLAMGAAKADSGSAGSTANCLLYFSMKPGRNSFASSMLDMPSMLISILRRPCRVS